MKKQRLYADKPEYTPGLLKKKNILEMAEIVHGAGGKLYYDGANLNAVLSRARPGDMGFDVVHLNLHKTFTGPHGGGGPGSGPVGVKKDLIPYLPKPVLVKKEGRFYFDDDRPQSIGRVKPFYGNFGINVRAYAYIRSMGPDGLKAVTDNAVLNANYMMRRLCAHYDLPFDRHCKHEFVLSGKRQKKLGVRTLDIAKRLLDFGYHPPTIYFPLNVEECIMIEPTETESKETLDAFIEAMIQIAKKQKRIQKWCRKRRIQRLSNEWTKQRLRGIQFLFLRENKKDSKGAASSQSLFC